ncbi:MAG: 4-alpha-glucanotransferase [Mogibacterium sp.]|nr:4-alpha-glucanotransferase [Mogibacterium sp.]
MRIIHDSRQEKYRKPFGAVPVGTAIELFIEINGLYPENVSLMLWRDEAGMPSMIDMKSVGDGMYSAVINAPKTGCLLWYAFAIQVGSDDDRGYIYYGNNDGRTGGEGRVYHEHEFTGDTPAPFQITVYKPADVPSWYTDGIIYQVFPDRFARDKNWKERVEASVREVNSRPGENRILQEDWNRPAYYIRDEQNKVTDWPIYGGSLRGIEDKLDYLKSLGVTGIYLNPVFESTSNHHYDTADYMKIDPSLGTEEDFAHLAAEARKRGIRLILDGVFSHTGADSKYFDMYGNYEADGNLGAYKHKDSPYRSWFRFDKNEPSGYKCWWGVEDLPEVEENDPGFRELILGEEGAVSHWMKAGASGWRLDVADELPDSFIQEARERIRSIDPEGLLIGEVWEDASNKISYGERRKYFMGDELDGVMNYPLRSLLLDYVNYTISSGQAGEMLLSLKENYPEANFYAGLNLIGSHDRERIITAMAAEEDYPSAVRKVRLLSVLQYALPGVPCIYYGDEVGLTGGVDPLNRNGYPWGFENLDLGYHYRMLGLIYDEHPVLKHGDVVMLSGREGISDDVFAFVRCERGGRGERVLVLANRSYGPVDVDLRKCAETAGGYALELLTSEEVKVGREGLGEVIHMERLSAMVICIMDEEPLREDLGRAAGVICHISSLGKGVLGTPAKEFADYLSDAGMKVWQVLPLNPAGLGGSPYSSYAAFAGNPAFINRDELPDDSGYESFCRENHDWLTEYAAFTVLSKMHRRKSWHVWPEEYRDGDPAELLDKLSADHAEEIDKLFRDQYYFHEQWKDLKEYANGLGIRMMGDLPMYMAENSADVWANKEVFRLDEDGRLKVHAGVPPDAFSKDGQDWGNPLYDWDKLRDDDYGWWLRRLKQCAERYDILRLDHFRGLSEYYAIPYGEKPLQGVWQHSAGIGFFRAIRKMLADEGLGMKVLAEDLGFLDAGVKNLLKLSGLPGMDIWQFTAAEMLALEPEAAARRAFYTGTHDNDTLIGFVLEKVIPDKLAKLPPYEAARYLSEEVARHLPHDFTKLTSEELAKYLMAIHASTIHPSSVDAGSTHQSNLYAGSTHSGSSYTGASAGDAHGADGFGRDAEAGNKLQKLAETEALDIIRQIYESPASLAMVQLQDMFMLGTEARMNVPGIAEGNWTWKIPGDSVKAAFPDAAERAAWFRDLAEKTGRQ